MTREELLELLGEIDDDLIERAAHAGRVRPPYRRWASVSLAACLCVVIASAAFLPLRGCGGTSGGGMSTADCGAAENSAGTSASDSAADAPMQDFDVDAGTLCPLAVEPAEGVSVTRVLSLTVFDAEHAQATDAYTLTNETEHALDLTLVYPYEAALGDSEPVLTLDGTVLSAEYAVADFDSETVDDPVVTVYDVTGGRAQPLRVEASGMGRLTSFGFASYGGQTDGTRFFEGNGLDRGTPGIVVFDGDPTVTLTDAPDGVSLDKRTIRLSGLLRERLSDFTGTAETDETRLAALTQAAADEVWPDISLSDSVRTAWRAQRSQRLTASLTLAPGETRTLVCTMDKAASFNRFEPGVTGYRVQAAEVPTEIAVDLPDGWTLEADGEIAQDSAARYTASLAPGDGTLTLYVREP